MNMALNNASANPSLQVVEPSEYHDIQTRAYELYEQRGREDGHELEDWLQAEAEINAASSGQQRPRTIAA